MDTVDKIRNQWQKTLALPLKKRRYDNLDLRIADIIDEVNHELNSPPGSARHILLDEETGLMLICQLDVLPSRIATEYCRLLINMQDMCQQKDRSVVHQAENT